MAKKPVKILIDFEAISYPFSKFLNLKLINYPYAYTIGAIVNNKFVTKTRVFLIRKNIYFKIRNLLINDIRILINLSSLNINFKTVNFIAWNPYLEKEILYQIFGKKVSVVNQNIIDQQSLEKLSYPEFSNRVYFNNFLKAIESKPKLTKMLKKRKYNCGLIAAIAGFHLFANKFNLIKNSNYLIENMNSNIILQELKVYSRDDVLRMKLFLEKPNILKERSLKLYLEQTIPWLEERLSKAYIRHKKILNEFKKLSKLEHSKANLVLKESLNYKLKMVNIKISDLKQDLQKLNSQVI